MNTRARFIEQFAALPWRMADGHPEVLLVTSRISRKWLLPKGWLINSLGPSGTAVREAYEEAGILGEVSTAPVGSFRYFKITAKNEKRPAQAMVFGLRVTQMLDQWPEAHQRHRAWFTPLDAAQAVSEPTLAAFLRSLPDALFCEGALYAEEPHARLAIAR